MDESIKKELRILLGAELIFASGYFIFASFIGVTNSNLTTIESISSGAPFLVIGSFCVAGLMIGTKLLLK